MDHETITIHNPVEGFVHEYAPRLTAFEFKNKEVQSKKVVLFIGGLTDGLLTVPYLPDLSAGLDKIGWTLVQIHFTSSYMGWGTGSLERDAYEISLLVEYLRSERGGSREKVVLMGHSTGCQDTIQYLAKYGPKEPAKQVEGGILQAAVSDREAIFHELQKQGKGWEELEELNALARNYVSEGREYELLPKKYSDLFLGAPINAYRWLSLATKLGDDDFFSSDLTLRDNKKTFGMVTRPIMVLNSEKDQFYPDYVDKQALMNQWKLATPDKFWSPHSGLIPGALHNIGPGSAPGAVAWTVDRVCKFCTDIE
ncbi:hypothetical protein KL918_000582 [Ogataea parapolymorpha]|uniref:Uncharacterized protein n=1 Tax=Ogataea parapolymorpha (strain ATCC 26012 / BCRC 20466 / JCM 22074 / NRRL Y-7560 / DL-1) TaxID=871575 RepID=W1Q9D6_OGAPD|nr:hypothetical protein HPODL_03239 [Ogataea parapolymorpha DL-1]ESW96626.1 hypothetical protein HPODL_03239 [Ogataea parapolymorpha DL-1]KAG7870378.1 hypothetical protein KL918_000582 [Ogataea parapolymorpha]KAG7875327.1 hypothetical protein KL916_000939 [Ogataea parapolymorpha]